jgi:hypothetical protein
VLGSIAGVSAPKRSDVIRCMLAPLASTTKRFVERRRVSGATPGCLVETKQILPSGR